MGIVGLWWKEDTAAGAGHCRLRLGGRWCEEAAAAAGEHCIPRYVLGRRMLGLARSQWVRKKSVVPGLGNCPAGHCPSIRSLPGHVVHAIGIYQHNALTYP